MRLLVLGGTHHVGRAVVETALARGDEVTAVTRGVSGPPAAGAEALRADRTDAAELRAALGDRTWDAVVDTWTWPARAVRDAANLLAGRAGQYTYISSRSVYVWPQPVGADESAPVVDGDPDDETVGDPEAYATAKRGGELAALAAFGDRALLVRAGLILGPYERVGRLPWWLTRVARGGRILAPGPYERPLQYVDARDLASWALALAERGVGGPFNLTSRSGHATMGGLLTAAHAVTGSTGEFVWVDPEVIERAGIEPWTELPIWLPPTGEAASLHATDVSSALATGLTCRPVAETVADTWAWMRAEGDPGASRPTGLDPAREAEVLASL